MNDCYYHTYSFSVQLLKTVFWQAVHDAGLVKFILSWKEG